jgi:hypothetical protein
MTVSPLGHSVRAGTCQVQFLSVLQYASYLSIILEHKQLKLCFYGICLDSQPELIHGRKPSLKFHFWIILIIHNNPLILDAIIYMYSCTRLQDL